MWFLLRKNERHTVFLFVSVPASLSPTVWVHRCMFVQPKTLEFFAVLTSASRLCLNQDGKQMLWF